MKNKLRVIASYYLCWIGLFFLERLFFIAYFYADFSPLNASEFLSTFLYGLRMDASMAAYICILPLTGFILMQWLGGTRIFKAALTAYTGFIVVLSSIITASNLNIYQEWGTKLPYRAVSMLLEYPREALLSASSSPLLLPLLLMTLELCAAYFIFRPFRRVSFSRGGAIWYKKAGIHILLLAVTFLLMRSGLQTTPLNPSMAYFSSRAILNHAAVNTQWNLMSDFLHSSSTSKNPYRYMQDAVASDIIAPYLPGEASQLQILTHPKPNVVLIILESFTADLVEGLGGEAGVTPHFQELLRDGLVFSNTYASSDRTDKGIIAIMSGFPSQGSQSIIKNVNKLQKLPGIGQQFHQAGYQTSFFHGGESAFYNFKSYMLSHGTQQVIDQHDFPLKEVMSKWGAFDHLTFKKQIEFLNRSAEPFFSTLLTLSNHEPFDLPGAPHFGSNSLANLFRSTAFYTDSALHAYLEGAKQQPWYENTLFVVIADHGHRLPKEKWDSYHPGRYKIPFLFYGPVLKPEFRGMRIDKIGGQTDLAATLLNQLGLSSKDYFWSRDLLNPEVLPFSFFTWNNGFGIITPEQALSFDTSGERRIFLQDSTRSEALNSKLEETGKAYLQEIYKQFLAY